MSDYDYLEEPPPQRRQTAPPSRDDGFRSGSLARDRTKPPESKGAASQDPADAGPSSAAPAPEGEAEAASGDVADAASTPRLRLPPAREYVPPPLPSSLPNLRTTLPPKSAAPWSEPNPVRPMWRTPMQMQPSAGLSKPSSDRVKEAHPAARARAAKPPAPNQSRPAGAPKATPSAASGRAANPAAPAPSTDAQAAAAANAAASQPAPSSIAPKPAAAAPADSRCAPKPAASAPADSRCAPKPAAPAPADSRFAPKPAAPASEHSRFAPKPAASAPEHSRFAPKPAASEPSPSRSASRPPRSEAQPASARKTAPPSDAADLGRAELPAPARSTPSAILQRLGARRPLSPSVPQPDRFPFETDPVSPGLVEGRRPAGGFPDLDDDGGFAGAGPKRRSLMDARWLIAAAIVLLGFQAWTVHRLSAVRAELTEARENLAEARGSLEMLWATATQLDQTQSAQQTVLQDSIRSVFAFAQGEIQLWQTAYDAQQQRLEELAARVLGNGQAIARVTAAASATDQRVDALATADRIQAVRFDALEEQDRTHASILDAVASRVQAQESTLLGMNESVGSARRALAALDSEISTLENRVAASTTAHTQLVSRVDAVAGWADAFRQRDITAPALIGQLGQLTDGLRRVSLRVDSLRTRGVPVRGGRGEPR